LLNNGRAVEQGYDAFGHLHIPETPFTMFDVRISKPGTSTVKNSVLRDGHSFWLNAEFNF
jgi:hypothetical protein